MGLATSDWAVAAQETITLVLHVRTCAMLDSQPLDVHCTVATYTAPRKLVLHRGNMRCPQPLTCSVFDCSRLISSLDDLRERGEERWVQRKWRRQGKGEREGWRWVDDGE